MLQKLQKNVNKTSEANVHEIETSATRQKKQNSKIILKFDNLRSKSLLMIPLTTLYNGYIGQ